METVQRSKLSGSFRIEIEQKMAKTVWLGSSNVTTSFSRSAPICVPFPDTNINITADQMKARVATLTTLLQDIRNRLRTISVIDHLGTSPVALAFSTFLLVDVL